MKFLVCTLVLAACTATNDEANPVSEQLIDDEETVGQLHIDVDNYAMFGFGDASALKTILRPDGARIEASGSQMNIAHWATSHPVYPSDAKHPYLYIVAWSDLYSRQGLIFDYNVATPKMNRRYSPYAEVCAQGGRPTERGMDDLDPDERIATKVPTLETRTVSQWIRACSWTAPATGWSNASQNPGRPFPHILGVSDDAQWIWAPDGSSNPFQSKSGQNNSREYLIFRVSLLSA